MSGVATVVDNGRRVVVVAVVNGANHNLQRPETVETLMYLWRVTKKRKWRDAGWEIIQAFNRCCKIESGGYVGLRDVTNAVRRNQIRSKDWCFFVLWRCVAHGRSCGVRTELSKGRHAAVVLACGDTEVPLPTLFSRRGEPPYHIHCTALPVHVLIWGFA